MTALSSRPGPPRYTEMMDAVPEPGVTRRYTDTRQGCLPVELSTRLRNRRGAGGM